MSTTSRRYPQRGPRRLPDAWIACGRFRRGWVSRLASPAARRGAVEAADHPDELALDPDGVIELRRIGRVRGLEPDPAVLLEEPLERDGVLLDLGDHDVPVPGGLLGADHDVVTIRDQRLDHGVAADTEEVGVSGRGEHLGHGLVVTDHLVCLDRPAGGDLADHRQHAGLARRGLRRELARQPEREGGFRREAQHPALGGATLQQAFLFEGLQVVMHGRGGGKIHRERDLPDRWRDASRSEHRGDVVEDLPLPFRVVLRHASSFPTSPVMLPNARSIVKRRRRARAGRQAGGRPAGRPDRRFRPPFPAAVSGRRFRRIGTGNRRSPRLRSCSHGRSRRLP